MVVLDWLNKLAHFIPTVDILSQRLSNICWLKLHGGFIPLIEPTAVPPLWSSLSLFSTNTALNQDGNVTSFKLQPQQPLCFGNKCLLSPSTPVLSWIHQPTVSQCSFLSTNRNSFQSVVSLEPILRNKGHDQCIGGLHSGTLPLHCNGILNVLKKCTYLHAKC